MEWRLCRASGILGLVVVVALVLAIACGPAATPALAAAPTPTAQSAEPFYLKAIDHEKAKRGGTLRLAAHGPPSMFDIYASGTIANVGAQSPMYDLLVRQDPRDPSLPIIPSLATSWTISSDGMTYTFNLRKGVKFHDGTDFEAADVKASFDRIVFPPANLLSLRILPIKETVVRDRYTVVMRALRAQGLVHLPRLSRRGLERHHQQEDPRQIQRRPEAGGQLPGHRTLHVQEPHHRIMGNGQEPQLLEPLCALR